MVHFSGETHPVSYRKVISKISRCLFCSLFVCSNYFLEVIGDFVEFGRFQKETEVFSKAIDSAICENIGI